MAYVEMKDIKESLNSYPESAKEALDNIYHGKVFIIHINENLHGIYKTKRGAKGYINRRQKVSYYDDYSQNMTTCGSGLEVTEVKESEILDPYENKLIWFRWLRTLQGHEYMYNNALHASEKLGNEEVQEYVKQAIDDMKNNRGLMVIEEDSKEPEQAQESVNSDREISLKKSQNNNEIIFSINEEKNGIEISFNDKPSEEVREQLKSNGFRWSKYQKIWYAKQNESRLQFVKKLTNSNQPEGIKTESNHSYPEIEVDDIESYTIDEELQRRENDGNLIFRTQERDHTKDMQDLFSSYQSQVLEVLDTTDNERIKYYLKKELQRFKKKYQETYTKMLTVKANNPSWAVTGRAGRNMSKYNKAMDRHHDLMGECVGLTERIEKKIRTAKQDIKRLEREKIEQEVKKSISQTNMIEFTTESKEIDVYGNGGTIKKRTYKAGDYYICKLWGMFRVFSSRTGKEVETTLNTTSTLNEAKLFVSYLIQNQQQAR